MLIITRILALILLAIVWTTLGAPVAFAQGSQRVTVLQGDTGQTIAGENICVCSGMVLPAYTSTPACSPTAAIYSDPTLTTPVTQPLVSAGLANYSYFAAAGTYSG